MENVFKIACGVYLLILTLTFPFFFFLFLSPKNFDQNKLEEEMRKRKERVEKWREEQRKKAMENIGELKKEIEEMKQGKKWSLEDDDGTCGMRAVPLLPCRACTMSSLHFNRLPIPPVKLRARASALWVFSTRLLP